MDQDDIRDRSAVDFGEALSKRLADKPHRWSADIAVRAALRVLPLMLANVTIETDEMPFASLQVLRAAFLAWVARLYDESGRNRPEGLISDSRAVRDSLGSYVEVAGRRATGVSLTVSLPVVARHLAKAAACAAHVAAARDFVVVSPAAANVAGVAVASAASATSQGLDDVLQSIEADMRWLEGQEPRSQLIRQPLWLDDVRGNPRYLANFPVWAREPFDAFDNSEWVTGGPWGVWLAWYRALLPNTLGASPTSFFGERLDLEIATKESEFWTRDPNTVTTDVALIVGWSWAGAEPQPRSEARTGAKKSSAARRQSSPPKKASRGRKTSDENGETKPPPPPPPPPKKREAVEPQSDEPTAIDLLGRRSFARALVERMDRLYEKGGGDGFAAHIHAPWGAGKTSVLMMMRELMVHDADQRSSDGKPAPKWVVVRFDAWQHERRNPPWWPLIEAIMADCFGWLWRTNRKAAVWLWLRWIWWKIRTDALPYIVFLLVAAISIFLLRYTSNPSGTANPYEWILKVLTAAITAFASFFAASRIAMFGSASNAKFYEEISQDPLKRITKLFKNIIDETNAPVCVFIDDLDRCRAEYVVDLLEGIQTSFRYKNVAYVVAADRAWIKASFEARYSQFSSAVGNAGQPLGYLFLEKIFQISTPVPGMGDKTKSAYWQRLLRPDVVAPGPSSAGRDQSHRTPEQKKQQFDRTVEEKRKELRQQHGDDFTRAQAEESLKKSDTEEDRAAVVLELNASAAAEVEIEHVLARFSDILPENPRVMKRMVNAFAMRQAIGFLERNPAPVDVLARWAVVEQRFPALADLLAERPEWVEKFVAKIDDKDREGLPPVVLSLIDSDDVRTVFGTPDDNPLTAALVRVITRGAAT